MITKAELSRLLTGIRLGLENVHDDLAVDENGSFDIKDYDHLIDKLERLLPVIKGTVEVE
ncbi:hypothetical protein SAMN04487969_102451 [Paenibacillus algorifonticola]|uniref:Uncharacterized protein n=1 Tax=Paenibacillus algorifonticola TaxID=684063 RepID=A0A1I2AEG1_9BACL|nr:hypothetical protein [Paenibacillus algorifonticola]SFE42395.1 hypothetical protein SAMN04487969_102451 [Paenibacillus algorifonticola]